MPGEQSCFLEITAGDIKGLGSKAQERKADLTCKAYNVGVFFPQGSARKRVLSGALQMLSGLGVAAHDVEVTAKAFVLEPESIPVVSSLAQSFMEDSPCLLIATSGEIDRPR